MSNSTTHIAFYCVNYHSYDSLYNYLASIEEAAQHAGNTVMTDVIIADNSKPSQKIDYTPQHFSLRTLITGENKGYFGAVRHAMLAISPQAYDYVIISNVDVLLAKEFLRDLATQITSIDTGWIAPQIYSSIEQRDRNPKILCRYAKRKLEMLRFLFRFPPLYNLYTLTAYKRKRWERHDVGNIYAGHGSFIILTREYFQRCSIIDYPVFLFCEEIYLGEQCRKHGLKVTYTPRLCVHDAEHASTGRLRRSTYCSYNYEAINYILDTFYR